MREPSIPYTTQAKKYGNQGEHEFIYDIKSRLPDCKIKKNIIIQSAEGNAEIDCLILYKNKLFAVEVKCWKGQLVEHDGDFVQHKRDRWTGEIHTKVHKSPFRQLGRAVCLLRKQIPDDVWINTVVFFEESDYIETESDNIWFGNINKLISYIVSDGKATRGNNASAFFEKCITADYLYSNSWEKSMSCIICDDSLRFALPSGTLNKDNIKSISISHHWFYDEVKIMTRNGERYIVKVENGFIYVINNGYKYRYALCKLDQIILGD